MRCLFSGRITLPLGRLPKSTNWQGRGVVLTLQNMKEAFIHPNGSGPRSFMSCGSSVKSQRKMHSPGLSTAIGYRLCLQAIQTLLSLREADAQQGIKQCGIKSSMVFRMRKFLVKLDPLLKGLREHLYRETYTCDLSVGTISAEWSAKLGIPARC